MLLSVKYNKNDFIQQEIARHLRPTTLRALYGKDKAHNAVHCTDLPEDGELEVGGTSFTCAHSPFPSTVENTHTAALCTSSCSWE